MTKKSDDNRRNGARPADERPEEFDRFEGLMRKLVKVPKSEVDAERKKVKPSRSPRPT